MPFRNEKSMTIRLQTYPNITFGIIFWYFFKEKYYMMKNEKDMQYFIKTDTHASYYFGRFTSNKKKWKLYCYEFNQKNFESHVNYKDRQLKRQ